MLLGAALGGVPVAAAGVSFERTDIALPGAPESVALGDLDGRNGQDIVMAFPGLGGVGVMLNRGDGTFGALQQYSGGAPCAGNAVDITLGDVTAPGNPFGTDGRLDAFVACTPYAVRLTGDGAGGLGNATPFLLYLPPYNGGATIDYLALMRRPDGHPAPLLVLQHAVGSFGREFCVSYELDGEKLVCDHGITVQGPLAVGDLNGSSPGVPPDEVLTAEPGDKLGVFGFGPPAPGHLSESSRPAPGSVESAALGDLDRDGDLDVVVSHPVNSLNAREPSIQYFTWDAPGLAQTGRTLTSIPGVDAVAVADVDGDGCGDIVAAGSSGSGMIHLGDGAANFDGGRDLPQLGYHDPGTATRVTLAAADLSGDGRVDLVVNDQAAHAVMVYRNTSSSAGGPCFVAPPAARDDATTVAQGSGAAAIDVLANDGPGAAVASVTQPAHGTAALSGGAVTYRPAAGYCNDLGGVPDTFTYALAGGAIATVAVTVQCVTVIAPVVIPPAVVPPAATPVPGPAVPRTCENPGGAPYTVGTPGDDVLVGTNSRDVLTGRGGDDCLFGRGGEDRMTGGTGADRLDGSSGEDRINGDAGSDLLIGAGGDDRLDGDAGDDKINGGNGNDRVTPGAGQDKVASQGGDDEIFARDGARDTIDCGAGRDKVTADRSDTIKGCEFAKLPKRARR